MVKRKSKKNIEEKQFNYMLYIMIAVIILVLGLFYVIDNVNKFTYENLKFEKVNVGKIPFYYYSYNYEDGGRQYKYNLYLRDDPRKLDVPVDGDIFYLNNKKPVYVTINSTGTAFCNDSSISFGLLADFLAGNLYQVKRGTPDKTEAKAKNLTYVTCENYPDNMVIEILEGSEDRIGASFNCYKLYINDCNVLEVIEKFVVQSIVDAKTASE